MNQKPAGQMTVAEYRAAKAHFLGADPPIEGLEDVRELEPQEYAAAKRDYLRGSVNQQRA